MNAYEEYIKGVVKPMREELVHAGFTELKTVDEVADHMQESKGTSLIVINSICGCAAGLARPAVIEAIAQTEHKPDHLVTVFAGQDREATAQMRSFFEEIPASSPSIVIWKDGNLAYFIPREQIEGFAMEQVRDHLAGVLDQVCAD
ncbi:BrxA/BrxB family bacilliredoxin [Rummeliibacillus suwonensis]|uniref:BrxA/BrxB family bacilliredoxin n=1 Tax=Rummeliibacillus suwonensis TaxID=1306154 RepID=UPI0028A2B274|nr:BrxA/BrxB family bacilliredoxin [Rummeliibacillus suwonensis]